MPYVELPVSDLMNNGRMGGHFMVVLLLFSFFKLHNLIKLVIDFNNYEV